MTDLPSKRQRRSAASLPIHDGPRSTDIGKTSSSAHTQDAKPAAKPSPKKTRRTATSTAPLKSTKSIKSFLSIATNRQQQNDASLTRKSSVAGSAHEAEFVPDLRVRRAARTVPGTKSKTNTQTDSSRPTVRGRHIYTDSVQRPWAEQFAPSSIGELAVHHQKVKDVRRCLQLMLSSNSKKKVLVLSGPSGCGKSTTCKLLAAEQGWTISRWHTGTSAYSVEDQGLDAKSGLQNFLSRVGQYPGLDIAASAEGGILAVDGGPQSTLGTQNIILMDELPLSLQIDSPTLQRFRESVMQYLAGSQSVESSPLVIVVSDSHPSADATMTLEVVSPHRLLGFKLLAHPGLEQITFNPIAQTLMTKGLQIIAEKEARISGRLSQPSEEVLRELSLVGDIRSAASSLEFLSLQSSERGGKNDARAVPPTSKKLKQRKSVTKPKFDLDTKAIFTISQREASLGLFHAVGKVVYNKRSQEQTMTTLQPPTFLPDAIRPYSSLVDVNSLIKETGTDASNFLAAIHENYVLSCNKESPDETSRCLEECATILSESELLLRDNYLGFEGMRIHLLRQDEVCFNVAVRGLLFYLPSPVKRLAPPAELGRESNSQAAFKMSYPTSSRLWKLTEETREIHSFFRDRTMKAVPIVQSEISRESDIRSGVELWDAHVDQDPATRLDFQSGDPIVVSARDFMLYRLPFVHQITSATYPDGQLSSPAIQQQLNLLRRAVTFKGVGQPEAEAAEPRMIDEPNAALAPTQDGQSAFPEENAQPRTQFFLSDDDIEVDHG